MAGVPIDDTTAARGRWSPLVIPTPGALYTFGETEFLTHVNAIYGPGLVRTSIRLMQITILNSDGVVTFKKSAAYDDTYLKPISEIPLGVLVPSDIALDMDCPVFSVDTTSALTLEFLIRIIP